MKILSISAFIGLLLLVAIPANAQYDDIIQILNTASETDAEVKIELEDGNRIIGYVIVAGKMSVELENANGSFNILYRQIKSVSILNSEDPAAEWYTNPAQNRLFVTPSGRMLDSGDGYYQNTYIFFSNFTFGASKYVSITGGFSMIPAIGISNQLFTLGAKVGTNINQNISVSGTATFYKLEEELNLGTVYAAGTYSKGRGDVTAGVGVGISEGTATDPMFIIGGQFRTSERFAFLTENLFIPIEGEVEPILSLGGRFIGERITADLGFFTSSAIDTFIPFVSFAVKL